MKNVKWTGVKRYEVEKNVANLYFDTVSKGSKCKFSLFMPNVCEKY